MMHQFRFAAHGCAPMDLFFGKNDILCFALSEEKKLDATSWNLLDAESYSRDDAVLQARQEMQQGGGNSPPASPPSASAQPSNVLLQQLNDMQLEREDNLGQQASGIRRTFYALGGKNEKEASDPEDREFIEHFKEESIARGLKEKNVNDFADSLARLSNHLTAKTGRGIVHRGLDDPALDKAAKHLGSLFFNKVQRALNTARANEKFRARSSEPLRSSEPRSQRGGEIIRSDSYGEDEALIALFIDRAPMFFTDQTIDNIKKGLRAFSTWLKSQNLPSINQLLSQDARLEAIRERYQSAFPGRAPRCIFAINTVKRMGLTVTPEWSAAGSHPFSNASSHSWPNLDEGGPINQPYGHEGSGDAAGSDFFRGLPWEQPPTPSGSVNQPYDEYGVSDSYPTGYSLPWSPPVQSQAHDPYSSTWSEPSSLNPPRPEIGHIAGPDWQHGNQVASDLLISMLDMQGLAPNEYMRQTEFNIHGERYRAVLDDNRHREPNRYNLLGHSITLYHVPRGG
ncbi:hypothetical protein GCT19_40195 [Paraburkholderia sp. CNPSo 3155]|uniref:hypothetical protein n=1 Tax=Paraburkholderia atlantica TaxID=2654982 RepID=UPI00128D835B|nr:hypothetical protein [Paraburkholderia atlantica]MPW11590.1 hypothetical protein [Paraburkholderia atlantica]